MLDSLLQARTSEYSATQQQLVDAGTQLKLAQNRQNASGQELSRTTDQMLAAVAGIDGMGLEATKDMRIQAVDTGGNQTGLAYVVGTDRARRALNEFLYGLVYDPTWDAADENAFWTSVLAAEGPASTTWKATYGLTDAHRRVYLHYLAEYAVLEEVLELEALLSPSILDANAMRRVVKRMTGLAGASMEDLRACSGAATRAMQLSETFDFTSPEGIALMKRRIRSRILVDAEANSLLGDLDMVTGAAVDPTGKSCVKPGDSQQILAAERRILARLNPYADLVTAAGRQAAAAALTGQAGNTGDASELAAYVLNLYTASDPDASLDTDADLYASQLGFVTDTGSLRTKLQAFLDSIKANGMDDATVSDTLGHVQEWSDRVLGDNLRARYYDQVWSALVRGGTARVSFISDLRSVVMGIMDATAWSSAWSQYKSGVASTVAPVDAPAVLDAGFATLPLSLKVAQPEWTAYRSELAGLLANDAALVDGMPQADVDAILRCVDRLSGAFVDPETADNARTAILSSLTRQSPTGNKQRARFLTSALTDGNFFTSTDETQMDSTAAATLNPFLLDLYTTMRGKVPVGAYLANLQASLAGRVAVAYRARVTSLVSGMVSQDTTVDPDMFAIQLLRYSQAEVLFWYDMSVAPDAGWVTQAGTVLDLSTLGSSINRGLGDGSTAGLIAGVDAYSGGAVTAQLNALAYNALPANILTYADGRVVVNVGSDSASLTLWRDYQQAWNDAYAQAWAATTKERDKILQVAETIGNVPGRVAQQLQNVGDQYAKLVNNMGPKLRYNNDPDNTLYNYSLIGVGGFGSYTGSVSGVVAAPKYSLVGGDRLMSQIHQFLSQETVVHRAMARVTIQLNTLGIGVAHITDKVADMRTGIEQFQQNMAKQQAVVGAKISAAIAQVLCLLDLVHDLIQELNGAIKSLLGAVNKAIGGLKGLISQLNNLIATIKNTLVAMAKALANLLRPKIGGGVNCACVSMGFVLGINSRNPFDDLADWLSGINIAIPDPFSTLDFSLDPKLGCPQNLLQGVVPAGLLSSSALGGQILGPLSGGVGLVFP